MTCAACGFVNPEGFGFCGRCGTALRASPASAPPPGTPLEAERRQLTVMFCDLVGSTRLAESLDPEDWRDVLRAYQGACGEVVRRLDGHVAQYLGDGLLVYFGYPHAHEDDARRAVRAGLDIVEAVAALNPGLEQQHRIRLGVRIGIHTGPVVAGEVGAGPGREALALGPTPAAAARLQGVAEPGTVVISGDVLRLVRGFFACRPLGPQSFKGLSQPVELFRVVRDLGIHSRFEITAASGLAPMVGRERDLARLLGAYRTVSPGHGAVAAVIGEAGIGKSRLVERLRECLDGEPVAWMTGRCSPFFQNHALSPIADVLTRLFALEPAATPAERLAQLEGGLDALRLPVAPTLPLLAALLGVDPGSRYAPPAVGAQKLKMMTLGAIREVLRRIADGGGAVLAVEDLHWADPSTLEFLDHLADPEPPAGLFVVLTLRPEVSLPRRLAGADPRVELDRLTDQDTRALIAAVAGDQRLPAEVLREIAYRTDGVPIFVEELTKAVLESGLAKPGAAATAGKTGADAIPTTLQGSLTARLDRLGPAREVALLASVLGREFDFDLLAAVWSRDEATLREGLERLGRAGLVLEGGSSRPGGYAFKHALVQDAAYGTLLRSARQHHHRRVAEVLLARFPAIAAGQPEVVAHHCTEAGLFTEAIRHWQLAGQRALDGSHTVEAANHLDRAVRLLDALPDARERWQLELGLQTGRATALVGLKGYSSPEVAVACNRALALCERLGHPAELFWVLGGLGAFYQARGDLRQALGVGRRMLRMADSAGEPLLKVMARFGVGSCFYFLGACAPALRHLEEGLAELAAMGAAFDPSVTPTDPEVASLGYAGMSLWMLGYPDRAEQRVARAERLARERGHPFSIAGAILLHAWVRFDRREPAQVRRLAREARALVQDGGLPELQAWAMVLDGASSVALGEGDGGIATIQEGLTLYRSVGTKAMETRFLGILAEAYGHSGRSEQALAIVSEGLAAVERTHERCWKAELLRMRGQLLGSRPEAEAAMRAALDAARRHRARSLELRAAASLGRLLERHETDPWAPLREVYGWFAEGLDTPDLREARALLGGS